MNVTELHPEELLQKVELTDSEALQLHAHLAQCAACRFERRVRQDFEREQNGPALAGRLISKSVLENAVQYARGIAHASEAVAVTPGAGAAPLRPTAPLPTAGGELLSSLQTPETQGASEPQAAKLDIAPIPRKGSERAWLPSRAEYKHRGTAPLLGAAALVMATVALAAGAPAIVRRIGNNAPLTVAQRGVRALRASAKPTVHAPSDVGESAAHLPTNSTATPPTVAPIGTPIGTSIGTPVGTLAAKLQLRQKLVHAISISSSQPAVLAAPAPELSTASTLFAAANAARNGGALAQARTQYEQLLLRFPAAPEASAARIALARLELDAGRAGPALAGYDAYLAAPGGELREQAIAGKAVALGRLGRGPEEARAWASLLREYPNSIHAEHAHARLQALAATER